MLEVFPSLSVEELTSDARLLAFWLKQSRRVVAVRNLHHLYYTRVAMGAESSAFSSEMDSLKAAIQRLSGREDTKKEETAAENWAALRNLGGG